MKTAARSKPRAAVSTARRGDPHNASRGAAVERAKMELAEALDRKLELIAVSQDELRMGVLAEVIGCSVGVAREMLGCATLGELEKWKKYLEPQMHADERR